MERESELWWLCHLVAEAHLAARDIPTGGVWP
jgi:hypothetical protein